MHLTTQRLSFIDLPSAYKIAQSRGHSVPHGQNLLRNLGAERKEVIYV